MTKRDPTKVWSFNYRLPASVLASVAPQSAVLGLEVKDLFLRLVDPSGSRLVQATLWSISVTCLAFANPVNYFTTRRAGRSSRAGWQLKW